MTAIVHRTQKHYRKLVDLFSHPGLIDEATWSPEHYSTLKDAALVTALTLFDNEVTVYTPLRNDAEELNMLTGASVWTSYENADYILINEKYLTREIFNKVKTGTLPSPEKSATFIIETDSITTGKSYTLKGPGIKGSTGLKTTLAEEWFESRSMLCQELPLGVEIILVDNDNNMTLVPRTTYVEVD